MKFGVVVFPGSNCDFDVQNALEEDLQQEVIMLWHKDKDLSMFSKQDCVVLPGGFSYGDYLRCGALARFSPMMEQVIAFANKGGKVLGICNGFQILCEAGLLPGVLLPNEHQKFNCKNIFLLKEEGNNPISKRIEKAILKIPIAHGEGRYYTDDATLQSLKDNKQILFRYCNAKGEINLEDNPNGSIDNIAGICNKEGNIFGMMPHPERACTVELSNIDGSFILRALF